MKARWRAKTRKRRPSKRAAGASRSHRRRRKAVCNRRICPSRPRSRTWGTRRKACHPWRRLSWSCRCESCWDAPPRRRPYRGIDRPVRRTALNWKVKARVTAKPSPMTPRCPRRSQGRVGSVKRTPLRVSVLNLWYVAEWTRALC